VFPLCPGRPVPLSGSLARSRSADAPPYPEGGARSSIRSLFAGHVRMGAGYGLTCSSCVRDFPGLFPSGLPWVSAVADPGGELMTAPDAELTSVERSRPSKPASLGFEPKPLPAGYIERNSYISAVAKGKQHAVVPMLRHAPQAVRHNDL
jgi:hypothetical protein